MKRVSASFLFITSLMACNTSEVKSEVTDTPTVTTEKISTEEKITPSTTSSIKDIIDTVIPTTENTEPVDLPEMTKEEVSTKEETSKAIALIHETAATKEIEEVVVSAIEQVKIAHKLFDNLLKKYVSANGTVNYAGLKTEKAILNQYTSLLAANGPESSWTRNDKLAYWINTYNAFTLTLIIDNYPLKSILDLNEGKIWDKKWIAIGTKTYSLNNIENDIIRPTFKEPRIHFAVNCAAKSCPKLMNGAFFPEQLNAQLEKQTKAFVNNTIANQLGASTVKISKIFEWYAVDFGNIVQFLNKYSSVEINANAKISYVEYDWALNK